MTEENCNKNFAMQQENRWTWTNTHNFENGHKYTEQYGTNGCKVV